MVYSVRAALSPDCAVVLLLELAIVAIPHRNGPVASAPAVSPQPAGLAAGALDWGRPVAAPPLFDVSGPDRQTDPLIAWSKCEESDKTRNILALQRLMSRSRFGAIASETRKLARSVRNHTMQRIGHETNTQEDRCWSGTGLESPFSDSALPCQP